MEQLLSPKALANLLGLAEQTIYNRHSTGGALPPSIKLGRLLRFRPSEVDAWITRHQCPATARQSAEPAIKRRTGRPTKAEQIANRRTH